MNSLFGNFINANTMFEVQPILDTESYAVHFYELLSRVKYDNKVYYPIEFIKNMSVEMRLELAKKLFKQISAFQKKYPHESFSLNLSSIEIEQGIDSFMLNVVQMEKHEVDPTRCIIEIAEDTVLSRTTRENIHDLKNNFGFRFALDDFGIKYSNLSQLSDLSAFEYVKIDGSMVRDIEKCNDKKLALKLIIDLIKIHKKKVIVEYIANIETLKIIKEMEPDYMQGFIVGKPMEIAQYLNRDFIGFSRIF